MAWPMEEPTATPLGSAVSRALKETQGRGREAYAAVLAICPKRPGPCEAPCCATGAAGFAAVGAYVEADRVCCAFGAGAGAREGVGREGARPAERERGIFGCGTGGCRVWFGGNVKFESGWWSLEVEVVKRRRDLGRAQKPMEKREWVAWLERRSPLFPESRTVR